MMIHTLFPFEAETLCKLCEHSETQEDHDRFSIESPTLAEARALAALVTQGYLTPYYTFLPGHNVHISFSCTAKARDYFATR